MKDKVKGYAGLANGRAGLPLCIERLPGPEGFLDPIKMVSIEELEFLQPFCAPLILKPTFPFIPLLRECILELAWIKQGAKNCHVRSFVNRDEVIP